MPTDDCLSGSEDSLASLPFSKPDAGATEVGLHSASKAPGVKPSRLSRATKLHPPASRAFNISHNPPQVRSNNLHSASRAGRNLLSSPSRAAWGQEDCSKIMDTAINTVQAASKFAKK